MPTCPHHRTALGALAALLTVLAPAHAAALTPLPASDYTSRAACPPASPGHATCLARQLVPVTSEARAHTHPLGLAHAALSPAASPLTGSYGLRPQDLHSAYSLPTSATGTQTIALVDAFNDPNAEADLAAYDEQFSLPACTTGGCFQQVNEHGSASELPFPRTTAELEAARKSANRSERERAEAAMGWDLEISLDVETAHAVCQSCHILLVEAESSLYGQLETAEATAERLGANEISNSWGGSELGETAAAESTSPFNHPGIVITASAGDYGYLDWDGEAPGYAEFPASSPHVVAVGGTRLSPLGAGGAWNGETVWNGNGAGGSGCSVEFAAPAWQQAVSDWSAVGCGERRAVADVSADADPYSGLAVHDTSPECGTASEHWCTIGGTSLSSPLIAAVFALAGGAGAASYPAHTLYAEAHAAPGSLHDVTSGSNGECLKPSGAEGLSGCSVAEEAASCSARLICLAGGGYDGPSGLGTPDGLGAFRAASEAGGSEAIEVRGGEHQEEGPSGKTQPISGGGSSSGSGAGTATGTSATSGAGTPPGTTAGAAVQLSGLALTWNALVALNRAHPRISQVAFAFTVNLAASVRVTLTTKTRRHRRTVWRQLGATLVFHLAGGRASKHLTARGALARGVYRLTVAPTGGIARTLQFQIG